MAFPRQKRPRGILCAKVGSDQSSPTLGVEVPIWKGRSLIEIDISKAIFLKYPNPIVYKDY